MTIKKNGLERKLVGDVLSKLGIDGVSLSTDLEGLKAVYGAWCRKIPFDNIQKLIHLESGNQAPLPGMIPQIFLKDGFDSERVVPVGGAAMPFTVFFYHLVLRPSGPRGPC